MIINSNTHQAESVSIAMEESINMSIDTSDQAALMMILSENLYKDAIGSLIRESVSNALDAQKEAGVEEAIIVSLKRDSSYNYIFQVQDFGTGISPEKVEKVISKYAASTKRGSNDYLGYFGLGMKAPLAYTDSFLILTNWEKTHYKYMMYKGEEGTKIDLVSQNPTEERNGTTIVVNVKGSYDQAQFLGKIKEQLAYFEGVYFDIPGFNNDFKIIKNKDWKYSSLLGAGLSSEEMHICLENVYYAIDWVRLGIPRITIPIGLNFSIRDGLLPIPSREDIKYTEEAKDLIKIKIAGVADYFMSKFNETSVEVEYIGDIIGKFDTSVVDIEGVSFEVKSLEEYSYMDMLKPSLKGVKVLDVERLCKKEQDWFANYVERGRISNSTFSGKWENHSPDMMDSRYTKIFAIIAPKGVELEYLKDRYKIAYFIYKSKNKKLGVTRFSWQNSSKGSYYDLLGLKTVPKNQWREAIKEWISIEESILAKIPKLEDLKPTPEWLEERKNNRKKGSRSKLDNGVINIKWGDKAHRRYKEISFGVQSHQEKIKDLKVTKFLAIYGTNENKEMFDKISPLLAVNYHQKVHTKKLGKIGSRVRFILLNKHDVKKVKELQNFISIENFMKGETKPFKAFATAVLIHKLIEEQEEIFNNKDIISSLSTDFASKLTSLSSYENDNYPSSYYGKDREDLMKGIVEVAKEHNLWDETIYDIYKEVNEKIGIFDFIKVINFERRDGEKKDLALELAKELLKVRKFRMDWQNYITLNPEVEEISKEIVDEETEEIMSEITQEEELELVF